MRVLHFDCFSGASGDMTLAALLDAGADLDAVQSGLASLALPITLKVEKVQKGGFAATRVQIDCPEEDEHRHLPDIEAILIRGKLTAPQLELALRIFRRLAEAEAAVHGIAVDKVHFHEVGALDSIADIAGAAIALDSLNIEHITSRSVPVGSGMVKCAHGMMPIPAPATAHLLRGVPLASSPIKSELTTPTGAAILTTIVHEWIESPSITIDRIGVGAGTRDFWEQPNVLRVFIGSLSSLDLASLRRKPGEDEEHDEVWMLETNLDDVPAEVIGYCFERLFAAGALDVFTTAIQMKKNRPGVMLSVLVPETLIGVVEAIIFAETGTLGIRRYPLQRHKMRRESTIIDTKWGPIKAKRGWRDGVEVVSPEYEDCARVAREHSIPLREVYRCVGEVRA